MKNLLTIAGSDSCGGAGIQADIKTFSAHGCYAMSVITAITAQNTVAVNAVLDTTPEMIKEQLDAIFTDIRVDGVKIGMVSAAPAIKVIVEGIKKYAPPIVVVDPVMVSTSGFNLLNPAAIDTLIHTLLPRATIITPNIPEAEILANMKIRTTADIETSAKIIHGIGAKYVLIKGGHMPNDANDLLYDGTNMHWIHGTRIATKNTHGTGCTLSSAITANLANGMNILESVSAAKEYVKHAIENSISLGHGCGPTNHFYKYFGGNND